MKYLRIKLSFNNKTLILEAHEILYSILKSRRKILRLKQIITTSCKVNGTLDLFLWTSIRWTKLVHLISYILSYARIQGLSKPERQIESELERVKRACITKISHEGARANCRVTSVNHDVYSEYCKSETAKTEEKSYNSSRPCFILVISIVCESDLLRK